ncbi:Protein S-acyltransferase 10 [Camellia lanceoleosa]|uniref:Protein S-acyltransferase 10 n=1 Tax=Camellia lanceoleosa TaxID=1840588 RepID=A0ACC0HMN3_9ERIC|nr:Protein S-acyltransferase 10 [Camellia lanceoleosa]
MHPKLSYYTRFICQNICQCRSKARYTAIYLLLFLATLAQYFLTSCSSPGYALDAMRAANETDALLRKTLLTSKNLLGSNATTWTKVVMEMYPPRSSVR